MVSDKVNVWHFPNKKEGPKYYFWLTEEKDNEEGHGYFTLEGMIDAAYRHIDPFEKKLPAELKPPYLLPPEQNDIDTLY